MPKDSGSNPAHYKFFLEALKIFWKGSFENFLKVEYCVISAVQSCHKSSEKFDEKLTIFFVEKKVR